MPDFKTTAAVTAVGTSVAVKRTFCMFYQRGSCDRGDSCSYAHHESDIGQAVVVDHGGDKGKKGKEKGRGT